MSFQNPVFIPGPTNIPESLRKACDMPTIDHRSPLFGQILHPARAGVRKVLKSESAEVFIFPSTGTGGWETALTNTLSAGDTVLAARNGMFSHRWIDMCQRHGLDVAYRRDALGRGPARRSLRGDPDRRHRPRYQGRAGDAQRNRDGREIRHRRGQARARCRWPPCAPFRGRGQLHRVDGLPLRRLGRRRRRDRLAEGFHAARGPRHRGLLPEGDGRNADRHPAAHLLRHPRHGKELRRERLPLHAGGRAASTG